MPERSHYCLKFPGSCKVATSLSAVRELQPRVEVGREGAAQRFVKACPTVKNKFTAFTLFSLTEKENRGFRSCLQLVRG